MTTLLLIGGLWVGFGTLTWLAHRHNPACISLTRSIIQAPLTLVYMLFSITAVLYVVIRGRN
jgi:hypothetical protein